jgi:hypothetical protein
MSIVLATAGEKRKMAGMSIRKRPIIVINNLFRIITTPPSL